MTCVFNILAKIIVQKYWCILLFIKYNYVHISLVLLAGTKLCSIHSNCEQINEAKLFTTPSHESSLCKLVLESAQLCTTYLALHQILQLHNNYDVSMPYQQPVNYHHRKTIFNVLDTQGPLRNFYNWAIHLSNRDIPCRFILLNSNFIFVKVHPWRNVYSIPSYLQISTCTYLIFCDQTKRDKNLALLPHLILVVLIM